MACEVTVRQIEGVAVIDLRGRLTLGAGPDALKHEVMSLVESGSNRILLNCSGLDFMDSAGLGEMVSCCTIVTRRGGTMKLCSVPPRIHDLLRMTRLTDMLKSYTDEKAGLEALGGSAAQGR
jgi:anti-sigma B factor antagonist